MRKTIAGGLACFALLLLGGCSFEPGPASTPPLIKTNAEIAHKRFECLKSKGWDVQLDKGAIYSDIPKAQQARFDADDSECLRKAGFDPDAPISDAQFREIYASYQRIETCLKRGGWSTPTRPSFEAFTATYETDPWLPWSYVSPADLPRAGARCPEMLGNEG